MPDYVANEPGFYVPDHHLRAPELLIPGRRGLAGFGAVDIDWGNTTGWGVPKTSLLEAHFNGKRYTRYADDSYVNTARFLNAARFGTYSPHDGSGWVFSGKDVVGVGKFYIDNLGSAENFIRGHYAWTSNSDNGGYRVYLTTGGQLQYNVRNNSSEGAVAIASPTLSAGDTVYIRWKSRTTGYFSLTVWDDNGSASNILFDDHTFTAGRNDTKASTVTQVGGRAAQCEWALMFQEVSGEISVSTCKRIAMNPYQVLKPSSP